jgi:DNA-binding response OmpR family regulator
MDAKPTILIADDESRIRRVLSVSLEQAGFDVMAAGDGEQALEMFAKSNAKPDMLILDLMMPGLDGLEVLEHVRAVSSVPVIMLTAKGELSDKTQAFRAGADDYLTKPFAPEELIARIHALLRRAGTTAAAGAKADELVNGPLKLSYSSRQCTWRGDAVRLSDTEFRLLWTLMKNKGAVLTHETLLRAVWSSEMVGELNTLRVTVARVRRKFSELDPEASVITNFSRVGYMMPDLTDM